MSCIVLESIILFSRSDMPVNGKVLSCTYTVNTARVASDDGGGDDDDRRLTSANCRRFNYRFICNVPYVPYVVIDVGRAINAVRTR